MNNFTGALLDTRSKEEKQKDFLFQEMVAQANEVIWVEKAEKDWRTFPVQDQKTANTCVAQTARKLLRIFVWLITGRDIDFSDADIYLRRANKPQAGMIGVDAMELLTQGTTLYQMMPSEDKTDAEIDAMKRIDFDKKIAEVFKISNYVQFTAGDFETVASTIQTSGKGVMIWFWFGHDEWSKLIPTLSDPTLNINNASKHSVTAVDFFLKNGKKYILVEDSAHFGGYTRHLISEEFFKARNFFSAYAINFKYATSEIPVIEKITKTLKFGMRDPQIKILQDILRSKGYFPINISITNYFGAITLKSVKNFQKDFGLTIDGIVGQKTREAL